MMQAFWLMRYVFLFTVLSCSAAPHNVWDMTIRTEHDSQNYVPEPGKETWSAKTVIPQGIKVDYGLVLAVSKRHYETAQSVGNGILNKQGTAALVSSVYEPVTRTIHSSTQPQGWWAQHMLDAGKTEAPKWWGMNSERLGGTTQAGSKRKSVPKLSRLGTQLYK
jgi:hypothetical protein